MILQNYPLELTEQFLFDHISTHLLTQGERAVDGKGLCQYRGYDQTACAVGCVIPDTHYSKEMEENSVTQLLSKGLLPEPLIPHSQLLQALQEVHDSISPKNWERELKLIASRRGLTFNPAIDTESQV